MSSVLRLDTSTANRSSWSSLQAATGAVPCSAVYNYTYTSTSRIPITEYLRTVFARDSRSLANYLPICVCACRSGNQQRLGGLQHVDRPNLNVHRYCSFSLMYVRLLGKAASRGCTYYPSSRTPETLANRIEKTQISSQAGIYMHTTLYIYI